MSYFRAIRDSVRKTQLRTSASDPGSRSFSCRGLQASPDAEVFSESASVTPTEISNQPRRPGSRMSARFNVTRFSPDSQTYPPFAVQVDSETKQRPRPVLLVAVFRVCTSARRQRKGRTVHPQSTELLYFRTPTAGDQSNAPEVIRRSSVPAMNIERSSSVREHLRCVQSH